MSHLPLSRYIFRAILLIAAFLLVISVTGSYAAYRVNRPVALADEPILQSYLYGEGAAVHKGVDFSAGVDRGDSVYAVAAGTVRDLQEGRQDGCGPPNCPNVGNFVLIEHDEKHYDRVSQQMAYVYSLYLHLQQNQVLVTEGQHVNAGTLIARADDTGNSEADHLHLQIVLHPQASREIEPINTLESETRSRNPELWLTPYNGTTGTVVGKVTNTNGDPVGGILVYGLQKQAGWGYGSSQTYNHDDLNEDDILVENWGTTDVSPGTYHVTLSNGTDMGWHTVLAGKTTYVGLYPVWLPFIRGSFVGWNSTIYVRNSGTKRAQVNTTYFETTGEIQSQRTDYINTNATLSFTPPSGFSGSAMVVSSEDVAVAVLNEHSSPFSSSAYLGVTKPDTSVMIPLVHRNNYGWNNLISIQNAGPATTTVTVNFKYGTQGGDCTKTYTLEAGGTERLYTVDGSFSCLGSTFVGSAQITASQPLAVTSNQYDESTYNTLLETSNAIGLANTLYAPLIQNNNYGYASGFNLQNAYAIAQTLSATYYLPSGPAACSTYYYSNVQPYRSITVYPAPPAGCTSTTVLSAKFGPTTWSTAAQVNQLRTNTPQGSDYRAIAQPTPKAIAPRIFRNWYNWSTGLQVQNAGTGSTTVTITYYNTDGSVHSSTIQTIQANASATFYPIPPTATTFDGSAVVTTDNGQNIAVIVNHLKTGSGDVLATHEAFNR